MKRTLRVKNRNLKILIVQTPGPAERLKDDAARIDVQVSDELDRRIGASLQGIKPEAPEVPQNRPRPAVFWWASSLTSDANPAPAKGA